MKKQVNYSILSSHDAFDVVDISSDNNTHQVGLKNKKQYVCLLPFTLNEHGILENLFLHKQPNLFREEGHSQTLLSFINDNTKESILDTIIYEFGELGYSIPKEEMQRWIYVGTLYEHLMSDYAIPIFCVDITNIKQSHIDDELATNDSLTKKLDIVLEKITTDKILLNEDTLVLSTYLRLFDYFISKIIKNNTNGAK